MQKLFFITFCVLFFFATAVANTNEKLICNTIQSCLPLAKKNNPEAAYYLYGFYLLGQDNAGNRVPIDKQKALFWLKESAKKNYKAQITLGDVYYFGSIAQKNYTEAFYWYKKSALYGETWAQYQMGCMYRDGEGTLQNYDKAFYWMNLAANHGLITAQYDLGIMYFNYRHDYIKTYVWLNVFLAQVSAKITGEDFIENARKERDQTFKLLSFEKQKDAEKLSEKYWQKYVLPYKK